MHPHLLLIISLQELDTMIEEKEQEEHLGFQIKSSKELDKARKKIVEKIPPILYRKYERLRKKYKNAVVPVVSGVCQGCYIALPISTVSQKNKNKDIHTCPNCGRILYWTDDR